MLLVKRKPAQHFTAADTLDAKRAAQRKPAQHFTAADALDAKRAAHRQEKTAPSRTRGSRAPGRKTDERNWNDSRRGSD